MLRTPCSLSLPVFPALFTPPTFPLPYKARHQATCTHAKTTASFTNGCSLHSAAILQKNKTKKNFNKQHLFLISLLRRYALSFFFPFLLSHPNAVVGIPYDAAYTQHNTEMSFSFTPLPQTLPYKYRRQDKRIRNLCSA